MLKVTNKYLFNLRQALGYGLAIFFPIWFVFDQTYLPMLEKLLLLGVIVACQIGLLILRNDWDTFTIIKEATKEH